jgi:hypothetical protein
MQLNIPSNKIKTIINFVKNVRKSVYAKLNRSIFFTQRGLCVEFEEIGTRCLVSMEMPLGFHGFMVNQVDLVVLSKAEGDIVFSFDDCGSDVLVLDEEKPFDDVLYADELQEPEKEQREDYDNSNAQSTQVVNSVHSQYENEVSLNITYTECGITKQIQCSAYTDIVVVPQCFTIPENTVESSKFLPTLATCNSYRGAVDGKYQLTAFCLEDDKIVVTDEYRICIAKDVGVPSLKCQSYCIGESDSSPYRHLLHGDIVSLVPKSGACRMASLLEYVPVEDSVSKTNISTPVSCLYIGFSDCHIWTRCVEGNYPNWRRYEFDTELDFQSLCIDKRDALICLKQLDALPKDVERGNAYIYLHFEEGRLCIDSCARRSLNSRIRFSELTTGAIDVFADVKYFQDILRLAIKTQQNPIVIKTLDSYIVFKSDSVMVLLMAASDIKERNTVASTTETQQYWAVENPRKQSTVSKPPKRNALFVNADKDRIAVLQIENEQLKKEIELLKNKIMEWNKSSNC